MKIEDHDLEAWQEHKTPHGVESAFAAWARELLNLRQTHMQHVPRAREIERYLSAFLRARTAKDPDAV